MSDVVDSTPAEPAEPTECCYVGRHPELTRIDAALRAGNSLRTLTKSYPEISISSFSRHRNRCLGLGGVSQTRVATSRNGESRFVRISTPASAGNAGNDSGNAGVKRPRIGPRDFQMSEALAATSEEEQTRFLANLIETNRFHFHHTLTWLEMVWKLSAMDVRHRYEQAVQRCSADRQLALAQLEVTLAALESQEREATIEFRRLRKTEPSQAKGYLSLAIKARTEYADLAGLKTLRIEANVNVWTHPAFVVAVDRFTEAALDVIAPTDEAAASLLERVSARLGRPVDAEVASAMLAQLQADAAGRFAALTAEAQGTAGEAILTQGVSLPEGT